MPDIWGVGNPERSAAMRRFTFKITYRSPDVAARVDLFARYFPAVTCDDLALDRLKNLTGLTPGDFAAVARKFRYAPKPPTVPEVMGALEAELGYRQPGRRVVGFGMRVTSGPAPINR